jgi:hypothetical protein
MKTQISTYLFKCDAGNGDIACSNTIKSEDGNLPRPWSTAHRMGDTVWHFCPSCSNRLFSFIFYQKVL